MRDDLHYAAFSIEIHRIDRKTHKAHVDAVRLLEVQSTSFIKGRTEHEAFEPRPPRASDLDFDRDGALAIREYPCFDHKSSFGKIVTRIRLCDEAGPSLLPSASLRHGLYIPCEKNNCQLTLSVIFSPWFP